MPHTKKASLPGPGVNCLKVIFSPLFCDDIFSTSCSLTKPSLSSYKTINCFQHIACKSMKSNVALGEHDFTLILQRIFSLNQQPACFSYTSLSRSAGKWFTIFTESDLMSLERLLLTFFARTILPRQKS